MANNNDAESSDAESDASPLPTEPPPWPSEKGLGKGRDNAKRPERNAGKVRAPVSPRLVSSQKEAQGRQEGNNGRFDTNFWELFTDLSSCNAGDGARKGKTDACNHGGCAVTILHTAQEHRIEWTICGLSKDGVKTCNYVKCNGLVIPPGRCLLSPRFEIFGLEGHFRFWPNGYFSPSQRRLRHELERKASADTTSFVDSWCAIGLFMPRGTYLKFRLFVGDNYSQVRECHWNESVVFEQCWMPHATQPPPRFDAFKVGVEVVCNIESNPCLLPKRPTLVTRRSSTMSMPQRINRRPVSASPSDTCTYPTPSSAMPPSTHPNLSRVPVAGVPDVAVAMQHPRCAKRPASAPTARKERPASASLRATRPASAGVTRPASAGSSAMASSRRVSNDFQKHGTPRPASARPYEKIISGPPSVATHDRRSSQQTFRSRSASTGQSAPDAPKELAKALPSNEEDRIREILCGMVSSGAPAAAWKSIVDEFASAHFAKHPVKHVFRD